MSEPEPLMETLTWYVPNPVFMPRQREFDYRAWFGADSTRQRDLSLQQLIAIADSVGCAERKPVLLSIGHRRMYVLPEGDIAAPYGATFRWTKAGKAELRARATLLPWYAGATSDENYRTFLLAPRAACR
jgi:hypothetical protein